VESYSCTGQPGAPQTQGQYEEYLGGLLSHGAKVVNIYGYDLPRGAEGSPFAIKNSGAIPAINRWLAGAPLPTTWYRPQIAEIQAKMAKLQQAARASVDHGRNPLLVMLSMKRFQWEFEPLMKAGKLAEAEAALDRALLEFDQENKGKP
jgi:hypothetical protein